MMKAICVDDEPLILQYTVSLCRDISLLDETEGFTKAQDALTWLDRHDADVALLDIDMPDMDGLLLAAKIREKRPAISIIFLTGYSQFALDAFSLHASGYLLKPISREKLEKEISFALTGHHSQKSGKISVRTFGNFEILADGKEVQFSRSKSKELLAFLIDKRGNTTSRSEAFAALWEDQLYDRPMQKQIDVIIRSLRSTLQNAGIDHIFEMTNRSMRIHPEMLDCDLYRFLDGDIEAIKAYRGEYLRSYSWGRLTEGYLLQRQYLLKNTENGK